MKDYILTLLAFGMFVCVVALIAKAVSTADPESAMNKMPTLEKTVLTDEP